MAIETPDPDDTAPLPEPGQLTAAIDADEILENVEVPMDTPDDVRQVNAIMTHPGTERSIRHMVVKDHAEGVVRELVVGLLGGREVWREERDHARYLGADLVYEPATGEAMTIEEYVETVGFDQPAWRLGVGFLQKLEAANGGTPF